MIDFELDSRLLETSTHIKNFELCAVRLVNDRRWPWIILVPRIKGAVEIHNLTGTQQQRLTWESAHCANVLQTLTQCQKINSGALGNVVEQLHFHIVGRTDGDPNWPGPIWGFGTAEPYCEDEMKTLISRFSAAAKFKGNY